MSRTAQRRARVAAAVDRQWGESFRLSPRMAPAGDRSARHVPDPSRLAFDFLGRFSGSAEDVRARDRNVSLNMTRPMVSAMPRVTVAKANLLKEVREGDLLERRETGERFVVGQVLDGRFDRAVLQLRPA
ncbi:hypothetical protein [Methylobacterium nodulans]|uniref:Uncharacterized protein n=1 Tax=Methylobacterium nodulans (strain LMG 21967 / CNCM I-2342 / ORS 2060) TaxID=460265 RepID=B8ICL6_METNO|nr:hypothetical protein [Methylobacterium nodulans]ACL57427.1 conserved hypothetical protein [Methylobacterium nodulans ORS 2060]